MDSADFDYEIPEPMLDINEEWLEAFIRKVLEKVKEENFNNELFYCPKEHK